MMAAQAQRGHPVCKGRTAQTAGRECCHPLHRCRHRHLYQHHHHQRTLNTAPSLRSSLTAPWLSILALGLQKLRVYSLRRLTSRSTRSPPHPPSVVLVDGTVDDTADGTFCSPITAAQPYPRSRSQVTVTVAAGSVVIAAKVVLPTADAVMQPCLLDLIADLRLIEPFPIAGLHSHFVAGNTNANRTGRDSLSLSDQRHCALSPSSHRCGASPTRVATTTHFAVLRGGV